MTKKHEMNEMELDQVAGGVSVSSVVEAGKEAYKIGKKIWDWFQSK